MAEAEHTADGQRARIERLHAQVERLRAVATAADRASRQIDETVQTLEPQVNTMQEAAVALTILVNLSGAVQREQVSGLNQLEPGDLDSPPSPE